MIAAHAELAAWYGGKIRAEILLHLHVRLLNSYTIVQHVYVILLLATWIAAARDQLGVFLVSIVGVHSSFLLLQVVVCHASGTLSWVFFTDIVFTVLILDESIYIILFRPTAIVLPHMSLSQFVYFCIFLRVALRISIKWTTNSLLIFCLLLQLNAIN